MTAGLRAAKVSGWTAVPLANRRLRPPSGTKKDRSISKVQWAELIGRVASHGDREAFKVLFEHFAPRIKGFLLRTGCSVEEAEDVAQGTMIAVWRKADKFDPSTTGAAAWIFTIARNLRIDSARRAARDGRLGQDVDLEHEPDPGEPVDSVMSRVEDAARITAAIEKLSADQSRVIRMSFMEKRPHTEIAAALGIPLGTVKSRIRLAMSRLRDLLDEET
jgi:RNA polymerase sigma-70 factor (ECF subfamily)